MAKQHLKLRIPLLLMFLSLSVLAMPGYMVFASEQAVPAIPQTGEYVPESLLAKVEVNSPEEIEDVLKRAEAFIETSEKYPNFQPIAFILHGPEVRVFARSNYEKYKHIVSLAAQLEAFNVVDIQVCEAQLQMEGIESGELPAFVNTVPYGPVKEAQLLNEGYKYF